METYYAWVIIDGEIYWEERRGEPLENKYDLNLFVDKVDGEWGVFEGNSGTQITRGETKEEAIKTFKDNEQVVRIKYVVRRCNQIIKEIGATPPHTKKLQLEIIKYKGDD